MRIINGLENVSIGIQYTVNINELLKLSSFYQSFWIYPREFGMGPNALITGGEDVLKTALVLGLGYSIRYGDLSIPLNLAFVKGPDGNRFSFIFGYAIPTG